MNAKRLGIEMVGGIAALSHTATLVMAWSGYLGVFLGIVGILTLIPAIAETLFMIFGPGMMAWSAWMGIVMFQSRRASRGDSRKLSVISYQFSVRA